LLSYATELDGTPYCYGGATTDCFDCSGFVSHCYQRFGITLPRTTSELYAVGQRVIDGLQPGDLVFFKTNGRSVSHVGIYVGSDRFIHASTSRGVITSMLTERYWQQRYLGARRLP
jgi:cell wall-associated NlpC family hydrolase